MDTIVEIKQNIKSVNKYLTDEHLDALSPMELLRNCNPMYRAEYAFALNKQGIISDEERKSIGIRNIINIDTNA